MSAPTAIWLQDLTGLDQSDVNEVLALLRENADICRRSAEMYGTRAGVERARGYFATFEDCALTALRYARICQANELSAHWFAAVKFEPSGAMPQPIEGRPTVSVSAACTIAAVTRATMLNWIADGRVDFRRTPTGAVRVFVDTLYHAGGQP